MSDSLNNIREVSMSQNDKGSKDNGSSRPQDLMDKNGKPVEFGKINPMTTAEIIGIITILLGGSKSEGGNCACY